jgi:hypothetical protein
VGRRVSDRGKKKKRRGAGLFAGEGVGPVGRCGLKGEGEVSFPFFFFLFFQTLFKINLFNSNSNKTFQTFSQNFINLLDLTQATKNHA